MSSIGVVWAHFFKIPTTQTKVKVGYGGVLGQLKKKSNNKSRNNYWFKGGEFVTFIGTQLTINFEKPKKIIMHKHRQMQLNI
jgi:hypothetical protein